MSAFSLMILEGISVSWHALEKSRFKLSLSFSSLSTSENGKVAWFCLFFFVYFSYIEYTGMFSVFYNQFNNRITNIVRNRIVDDIFRAIKVTEKILKHECIRIFVFSSFETISFSSINVIFSLDVILSERKGLTVFQNVLLSVTFVWLSLL